SVTSIGPNGFACCSGPFISPFFMPSQQARFDGPRFDETRFDRPRSGGRRFHDRLRFPVGVIVPAYVPYAVPYPVGDEEDDVLDNDAADANSGYSVRGRPTYDSGSFYRGTSSRETSEMRQKPSKPVLDREVQSASGSVPAAATDSSKPVAAQPATVLI